MFFFGSCHRRLSILFRPATIFITYILSFWTHIFGFFEITFLLSHIYCCFLFLSSFIISVTSSSSSPFSYCVCVGDTNLSKLVFLKRLLKKVDDFIIKNIKSVFYIHTMLVVAVMYQSAAAAMTFDPCGAYVYGRHLESSSDNDNDTTAGSRQ